MVNPQSSAATVEASMVSGQAAANASAASHNVVQPLTTRAKRNNISIFKPMLPMLLQQTLSSSLEAILLQMLTLYTFVRFSQQDASHCHISEVCAVAS